MLNIDTAGEVWECISVGPKVDRATGAQKADRGGIPRWAIAVLRKISGLKPEVVEVVVSAPAAPQLAEHQPIEFAGLRVGHWENESGSGLFVQADSARTPRTPKGE